MVTLDLPATIDLAIRARPDITNAGGGYLAEPAGDVNGDGIDDMIVETLWRVGEPGG